jgi:hypothetical protein
MATRARTTFQKRQKEMARKDKQQRKAERREQRKMARTSTNRVTPQEDSFSSDSESELGQIVSRHIAVDE